MTPSPRTKVTHASQENNKGHLSDQSNFRCKRQKPFRGITVNFVPVTSVLRRVSKTRKTQPEEKPPTFHGEWENAAHAPTD